VSELRVFGAGRLLQDEEEVTGLSLPTLIYLIVLLLTDACRVHCRCCVCQLRFCAVSRCNDNCILLANNASGGLDISSPAHCVLVMHSHSKSRQFITPLTKFSKPEEIIFNRSGTLHGCTTIRGTSVMTDQGGPVASGAHAGAGAGRGAASRGVASPQRDSGVFCNGRQIGRRG
jgi:hypothetical protein